MKISPSFAALVTFLLPFALLPVASLPRAQAAPDLLQQFPVKGAPAGKVGSPQSQIAMKGAFPTVAKSALAGALDAKNLAAANKSVGKSAMFIGTVAKVYVPKSGARVLLNLAPNYKTAVVGVVKAADFRRFPDLKNLRGQRVALRGKVILYKGAPEVELSAPSAIRIVK